MRKFFTLLMAVAMVATVQAQVQFNGRATKSHLTLNREKVSTQRGGFQNQMRPKALGNLITEQPEGEVKQYVRSGFGFTVSDGTLFTTTQDAMPRQVSSMMPTELPFTSRTSSTA